MNFPQYDQALCFANSPQIVVTIPFNLPEDVYHLSLRISYAGYIIPTVKSVLPLSLFSVLINK